MAYIGTPAAPVATVVGDNAVTTRSIAPNAVTPPKLANSGSELSFRNRIINGDMRIDQRNAGASVTAGSGNIYSLDRWKMLYSVDNRFTVQQQQNPIGIPFSATAQITSSSAYSVGAGEIFAFQQAVEGFNIADLKWGTASAASITLGFWANSSLTGTFGGSVMNSATNRSYPFTYVISAANIWEFKTVTIPGDTTGTWLTTNGVGLWLSFGLGGGSTFSGTAGAWTGSARYTATGATSVVGTSGATFYITGVQLEAGTVATPFERRDYGRELMMCQRYYTRFLSEASYSTFGIGTAYNTVTVRIALQPPVRMRAKPTSLDASAGSTFLTEYGSAGLVASAVALSGNDSRTMLSVQFTVSGATAGASYAVYANGTTNAYLGFGAEL